MMEQEELKRKLMGLWEKTTHSSKELIATLFNYYFNPKYMEYKENDGKIVSALLGIPYTFGYNKKYLKGIYLISLSSEEGFQKKGNISELFNAFHKKLANEFDFTFIVPHSELIADFYSNHGYWSSFFILEERFTPLHDFKNDYLLSLTDSNEKIRNLKISLFDEIRVEQKSPNDDLETKKELAKFIEKIESRGSSSTNLCHTDNDLLYIMEEESIRNLTAYVAYDSENKITGIAFIQKEDIKRIRVVASYVTDICSYYALLDFIKKEFSDYSISINTSESKYQIHSIIQHNYAASNPKGGDLDTVVGSIDIPFNLNRLLQPMGMVRILRFENILKYIAETRSDVDFQLQIRDYNPEGGENTNDKRILYKVKNGEFVREIVDSKTKNSSILNLSIKEVSELLLRKKDTSNLIMEAFGIPRLDLQLRLLPC